MTSTEKAIRDFCGHHADWWPSVSQVQEMLSFAQPCKTCEALARTVMMDQTSHDATPPAQPATVQEPVAWAVHYNGPIPLFTKTKAEAEAWGGDHILPLYTTAAQPAVPDAIHHTDLSEHPQYIEGWNDCRAEMLKARGNT